MLVAVHPVPAVDISLHQAFAASVSGRVSIGRVEGNTISLMRYNSAAPADKQQQDNLVNMVRLPTSIPLCFPRPPLLPCAV